MDPLKLVCVEWDDAYNNAGSWHTLEEAVEFARKNSFRVKNVGWLIHEDDSCYLLSSRHAYIEEQYGLIERIPKKMVRNFTEL